MKKTVKSDTFVSPNMGDKSQFTEIYNLYYESLCYFALRYMGDSDQAEDIIGDLFARLWQQSISFNDSEHLKAYLYRSASNACYTQLKATQNLKAREDKYGAKAGYTEHGFINNIIRAELWREVYQAIDNLPRQCSRVIKMSYVEGLKNGEIAVQLGLSLQTVKNHKQRGISILRDSVSKETFIFFFLFTSSFL